MVISSLLAGSILALAGGAPAFAWGGPKGFGSNCSAYSVYPNSAGNAGANTIDVYSAGYSLRAAFRGSGHTDIAPQTGTGYVISYIAPSVVNAYAVAGGYHTCASWVTTT
jgi:hypothetical protein